MKKYDILLHARWLLVEDDEGVPRKGGVYIWKIVPAQDSSEAVKIATQKALDDPRVKNTLIPGEPPSVEVEEINLVEDHAEESVSPVFYVEKPAAN